MIVRMNLQHFHVKTVKSFRKSLAKGKSKEFIIEFAENILNNSEFAKFLKKRTKIYSKLKKNSSFLKIINTIVYFKSKSKISKTLSKQGSKEVNHVFEFLLHSYLQWKDGFELRGFSMEEYAFSKKKIIGKVKNAILNQPYNVALLSWGSFLMRKEKFSLFSDVDLVMVLDDNNLLRGNNFKNFLLEFFKKINTTHYNLPTIEEIKWLKNSEGIARCGSIKEGIFLNFKIINKKLL